MKAYDRVNAWEKKHGYGLTKKEYLYLVRLHKNGNQNDREFVEELLEDINFHAENSMLSDGDYVAAINAWEED